VSLDPADLSKMTFIYKLQPYPLKMSRRRKINFLCQCIRKLSYYIQC